ncbi:hypothetical protein G7054_g2798 [Neopestalotiopsis clavispora]|nr:hypothetical protein G7054_g2798 [Neopestalotiopsis clavispora]
MAYQGYQDLSSNDRNQTGPSNAISTTPWEALRFLPKNPPRVAEYELQDVHKPIPNVQQQPPSIWRQWWAEILNTILMIGSLCGMIGVLYRNQNKPLPDLPFSISINTVVSILSTVLKASAGLILAEGISDLKWKWFRVNRSLHDLAVFDKASRGPWGCLRLLVRPRGTHLIASLGAALIILILAMDPFIQQLIQFYDCQQNSTSASAALPRTIFYDEAGAHTGAGIWPPATPVLGYIDQGLYNPSDIKTPFTCATGNCTFDDIFSTLGFCATCEDMTSQLTISNVTVYQQFLNGTTNETESEPIVMTNTTLPSGSWASIGQFDSADTWFRMNATLDGWIDVIQASNAWSGGSEDWYMDHRLAEIIRPGIGGCNTTYDNNTWACSGFGGSGAARCKIKPCAKSYNASIVQGELTETLVKSPAEMFLGVSDSGMPVWLAADVKCAGPEAVSRLQDAGYSITNDDIIIPWNVMVNVSDGTASIYVDSEDNEYFAKSWGNITVPGPPLINTSLPLDIIPANCLYQMTYPAVSSIGEYIDDYFTGAIVPLANDDAATGPPQLRAVFNDTYASFDSINAIFNSVADALSVRVRTYDDGISLDVKPASGRVHVEQTCVSVRWPFLAFPIAVVVLTTVFLTAIVGYAALGKAGTVAAGWKSSPLPMAFNGLAMDRSVSESAGGTVGYSSNLDVMDSVARRTMARVADSTAVD